ncbi:MAG: DUF1566 domain-containing protein [Deltaproteobacteria bacterium]|nr:DUF1566 domain-containing protein [Deltaproteobacteria bacterium]
MQAMPIRIFLVLFILALIYPSSLIAATEKNQEKKGTILAMAKLPPQPAAVETARDVKFIAYDDGTVLDTRTGLMWAAKDNGSNIKWADARSYCKNYRGGGYTDWRMPTQDELAGLFDEGENQPCNGRCHITPLIDLTDSFLWASEKRGADVAFFSFTFGGRYWSKQSSDEITTIRALPVRSVK